MAARGWEVKKRDAKEEVTVRGNPWAGKSHGDRHNQCAGKAMEFETGGVPPRVDATAVIAPTAAVSGNVTLGAGVIVSFGAVLATGVVVFHGAHIGMHAEVRIRRQHGLGRGKRLLTGHRAPAGGISRHDVDFLTSLQETPYSATFGSRCILSDESRDD